MKGIKVRGTIWWQRASKFIAYFLLGASFGGAVMLLLLGNQIDALYGALQERSNELEKITDEKEHLEEQLHDEQKEEIIQSIDLNLLEEKDQRLNKVTREMIHAEVYQWLKQMNIVGEPVRRYEELPQFFRETVNNHKIKLDQKEFQLQFDAVAIGSRVRLWFYVIETDDEIAGW